MRTIFALTFAATLLAACGPVNQAAVPDPSMAACTVTRAGQTLYVNSGYGCGDPTKNNSGTSGGTAANGGQL